MKKKLEELRALMARLTELRSLETMTDVQKEERKKLVVDITAKNEEVRELKDEEDLLLSLNESIVSPPAGLDPQHRSRIEVGDKPIYRSFGDQLKDIVTIGTPGANDIQEARKRISESEKRMIALGEITESEKRSAGDGQQSGVDSLGGIFVQTDYATEFVKKGFNNSAIMSKTQKRVLTSGANSAEIYGIDENSRKDGSRNGGVQVFTKAELEAYDSSKARFAKVGLKLDKITGLLFLSDEIIEDAGMLEGEVSGLFPSEFDFKLQVLSMTGTGAGEPLGILNSNALITVAKDSSQAAKTITATNISNMKARCAGNPEWYANRDIIPQLDSLFRGEGAAAYALFKQTGANAGILDGIPITFIEQCETLGTKGDLVLADFGQYVSVTKGGLKKAESMDFKFDYGQKAIRWTIRYDGQPRWKAPLTPYKGTVTTSPFVALANRA